MKKSREETKEKKKLYEKPELIRHGKLTDVTANGTGNFNGGPNPECIY